MRARIQPAQEDREYYFQEGCHILELSNSSDDTAVSIARARVPPGVTTQRHVLRDVAERYVILAGSGTVTLDRQPPRRVGAHDVVCIPPGCPQQIANSGEEDLLFLAICTPRFTPDCYQALT